MTTERASWILSRRLFLAGIALTFACAFASLGVQVLGLFGSQGIVPLAERMELLRERLAASERLQLPSLLWLGASDAFQVALCWTGFGAALLALFGVVPRAALLACWALYLSFVSVGSPFLDFQWDYLLLEAGLLAVLYAPGGLFPFGRNEGEPSTLARFLVYALLFKLMVLSGAVKLLSGDESWRDGTALSFHYWTQPLPHRVSVLAAAAPAWFQQLSVLVMFTVELALPCLLLVPLFARRLRQLVAAGVVFLMAVVFATGNYGFFNLLTALLCVPLLDDRAWRTLLRRKASARPPPPPPRLWRTLLLAALAAPLVLVSATEMLVELRWLRTPPGPLIALDAWLAPFRSVNSYGLFRVMTKERPEIEVEGSADGATWLPYRFPYKPCELERAPVFAGLHMPRLDWQMWFAALAYDSPGRPRWFADFLDRLLEGSPQVLGLLRANPFPTEPPRFVRATVAPYRFAGPEERALGRWWQRGESAVYLSARTRER